MRNRVESSLIFSYTIPSTFLSSRQRAQSAVLLPSYSGVWVQTPLCFVPAAVIETLPPWLTQWEAMRSVRSPTTVEVHPDVRTEAGQSLRSAAFPLINQVAGTDHAEKPTTQTRAAIFNFICSSLFSMVRVFSTKKRRYAQLSLTADRRQSLTTRPPT